MLDTVLSLNAFAILLVFCRVGTAIAFLPGFSAGYVSVRIRLLFGLAIAFLLTPLLVDSLPPLPATLAELGLLVLAEALIGAFLGTLARIVIAALHAAGTFASYFMSFASALVNDPVSDQQSATIAGFFGTMGVVLIFVTDLHHLMLGALVESYALFIPAAPLSFDGFAELLSRRVADSFALGLQLAAPFLMISLTYYIGLGILGRLMPQLPVFFFGLPIQIGLQIWVMMLTLSATMMVFLSHFADTYGELGTF